MIVEWMLKNSFAFIRWLLSFLPPDLQNNHLMTTVASYVADVYAKGGNIFFLFVPAQPFKVAIDILFFWLIHTPGWKAIMWALRKIPFLGIE